MPNLQMPEIILIVLVVVLLFGAKKLPDTARGLGRSLRIFKAETKGLRDEDKEDTGTQGQAAPQEPRQISTTETPQAGPAETGADGQPQAGSTPQPAQDTDTDRR